MSLDARTAVRVARDRRRRDSLFVVLLRSLALAVAGVAFAWQIALPEGVVAAATGAVLGVIAGQKLGESRLRLTLVLATGLSVVFAGIIARGVVVGTTWLVVEVGISRSLAVADSLLFGLGTAGVALAARGSAVRYRPIVAIEIAASAAALASLVAAHRDGAINRPIELADWAWARGEDPATLLAYLGAVGTLVLVLLLLGERRARRAPLHLGAVVAILVVLLGGLRVFGLPTPDAAGDLGLTGEPKELDRGSRSGRGERDDGGGRAFEPTDLPFRREYRRSGGDAPVAVVLLHNEYSPPSAVYYFRQSSFSQYNGHRLVAATRSDVDQDLLGGFPVDPIEVLRPPGHDGRVRVETTVAMLVEHLKPFALESPLGAKPSQSPDATRFRRAYRVSSLATVSSYEALLGFRAGDPSWSAEVLGYYTAAPSDPRYRALAAQIVSSVRPELVADPLAQALAIKHWLDDNGTYSRRTSHGDGDDPTASFLFGDRTGYCVHFAHAAAYLIRSRGIPARVASGYAVSEENRGGGSTIMIRGKEAHAWPEIYLDGIGWLVVDIQPHRTVEPPESPPDQDLQRTLGEMARGQHRLEDKLQSGERRRRSEIAAALARWARTALRAAEPVLALILIGLYGVKLYRRSLGFRLAGPRSRTRLAYLSALDRLAEVGLTRRRGETREAFAARLQAVSPTLPELTRAHLAAFFGSRMAPSDEVGRMAMAVGREVRSGVALWRVLVGLCNPLSWLATR